MESSFSTSTGEIITDLALIHAAREYASEPFWKCVRAVSSGAIQPNDPVEYVRAMKEIASDIEAGLSDGVFATWQRMNYFLTGESVALLPKTKN